MAITSPTYVKFKVSLTFAKMPTNLVVGFLPKFHREKARPRQTSWTLNLDSGFAKIGILGKSNPEFNSCLLYTSPSPRDATLSRMPSSA